MLVHHEGLGLAIATCSTRSFVMNRRQSVVTLVLLAVVPAITIAAAEATSRAQTASADWLKKLDAADYSGTWATAASIFKAAVSSQSWQPATQSVRAPLGAVRKRTDKSVIFTRSLPGIPDGEYVVIEYDTTFENKAASVETITVALDQDGTWRVAGYFIK